MAFFSDSGRAFPPPPRSDVMQLEFENAMLEALRSPLDFDNDDRLPAVDPPVQKKSMADDALSLSLLPDVLPCIAQPTPAATVELQVDAVTQQVNHLNMIADDHPKLFTGMPAPLLPTPKPPRTSAPAKTRATSAPSRRSTRQATTNSSVLVSQRAALRLVQELGVLGPKDKMTPEAAAALIKRFDEPLSEADIEAIARLTSLDVEALKIAVGMAGPDGAAQVAD